MRRTCLWLFAILSSFASCALAPRDVLAATHAIDAKSLAQTVTIYRDEWGVPHIDAPTDEGVVFGFAFACMRRLFLAGRRLLPPMPGPVCRSGG